MDKLVSIIMPTYNVEKYIAQTLESVIAQTYQNWELEITDDCSRDNTVSIINQYAARDARIHLEVLANNGGAAHARNKSTERARGRYVAFLDSDDWWYPTKIEEQLRWMQVNNIAFSCTNYEDCDFELNPYYVVRFPDKRKYSDLIYGASVGTPGVIYDTNIIGKVYMPLIHASEDWAAWLLILRKVPYLYTYPRVLWKYRHLSSSLTSNRIKQARTVVEAYKKVLGYSWSRSMIMFMLAFMPRQLIKKIKKRFTK